MTTLARNTYAPDYCVHPGEILHERLEAQGMKESEFADRCQISAKTVSQIINGKAPISPQHAIQFERVLGVSARLWNNLDAQFRLFAARKAEQEKLQHAKGWERNFPVADLARRGLIPADLKGVNRVAALLNLMGMGSIEAYNNYAERLMVSYRKSPSFKSSKYALAVWLRMGERAAQDIETAGFNRANFRTALETVRRMAALPPRRDFSSLIELCAGAGVAVVCVPAIKGTCVSGAARWLQPDKALVMLSDRYKTADQFWFTFFHESGHILLHGKKDVYIDEEKMEVNEQEHEADEFAANLLIEPVRYVLFVSMGEFTKKSVQRFAASLGISPGIIVGRLQHDGHIPYSWLNDLKQRVEFW